MTIHFIGAGPGAPDLLTLRGRDLIARCPLCLYAGSLVPKEILAHASAGTRLIDTAPLSLPEIVAEMAGAHAAGQDVARLHSGDPSLYSAVAEQAAELRRRNIPYEIVPGVPAFSAAAAALGMELTVPGTAQTVVLTRLPGSASPMPDEERLEDLARGTLVLHLAARRLEEVVSRLLPVLGPDMPAAVVARAAWPDQAIATGTLATIVDEAAPLGISRTAVILVGRALTAQGEGRSALYDPAYDRPFKPGR